MPGITLPEPYPDEMDQARDELIRRDEESAGDGLIELDSDFGKRLGFTSDKFDGWLWKDGDRVMISMIISRQEGKGNLSRLFAAIEAEGLRVAVPTPFPRMEAILRAKGFVPHVTQTDLGPCEVWEKPAAPPGVAEVERILGEGYRSPVTITSSAAAQAAGMDVGTPNCETVGHRRGEPAPAAVSDEDLLARFAELVLLVNAARFIS